MNYQLTKTGMKKTTAVIFFLTATSLLSLASCKDNPIDGSTSPLPKIVERTEGYFVFDTTKTYLARQIDVDRPGLSIEARSEYFLPWEKTLGEPFIDNNNNGTYDPGMDVFIIAISPENMDLNRNSIYDGPSDYCNPGVPFDDINGDGICAPRYPETGQPYQQGLPFEDINRNGVFDIDLGYSYMIQKIRSRPTILDGKSVMRNKFIAANKPFQFVSDSGYTYETWGHLPSNFNLFAKNDFYTTDSSISYYNIGLDGFMTFDLQNVREIDTMIITGYSFSQLLDTVTIVIEFYEHLGFLNEDFDDLLHFKFSRVLQYSDPIKGVISRRLFTDYYFAKESGLRAIRREHLFGGHSLTVITEWEHPTPTSLTR